LLDTDEMFSLHSASEHRSVQINQVGRMRSFVLPAVIQNLPDWWEYRQMDQTEQKTTLWNVTQPTAQQRPCQAKHSGCRDEKGWEVRTGLTLLFCLDLKGIKLRC